MCLNIAILFVILSDSIIFCFYFCFLLFPSPKVSSCTLASSSSFTRSRVPPPTPPLGPVKSKNKGKMEDLNNIRNENPTEWVEASDGHDIRVPNKNVSQLVKKLLKFQEELDQVRNLASL